ncbi:MAG: hypothetical protein ACYS9C_13885 [Planctomycetota bacterium]|jgi:hypothetical protein
MSISVAAIKDYDKNSKQPTTNVIQNKARPERSRMGQFRGSASACAELVERSAIWQDEEEAVFSFALVARPVILNAKIRQLRRPMGSEHI